MRSDLQDKHAESVHHPPTHSETNINSLIINNVESMQSNDFFKAFEIQNKEDFIISNGSSPPSIHANPPTSHSEVPVAEKTERPNTVDARMNPSNFAFSNVPESPSTLIFSPPNTVPIENRLITQPNPSTYVAPVKAAGDVSLNGFQLVQFLTKASLRLKEGTTQEGVQVRLNKLHECVSNGLMTAPCLKKLNYIVDEIDRELYDEAWTNFEQFVHTFPDEAIGWSQGVRILLIELRRNAYKKGINRSNSAGSRKK
uniref:Foie-gras_1 domain-containing protein n=1 Tax=Panagrellus redivivus TaxID=6233 RepID=A0A7E4W865_PANRE